MAIDTPARHIYEGDGFTRVFPIPTFIRGDDYIRIEIDGEYQVDRSLWDIVNNSIIFTTAPSDAAVVDIQVATSIEALSQLGSSTNMDIVADNIDSINTIVTDIDIINTVATDIGSVNIVGGSIDNVNIVGNDIDNVNSIVYNITNIDTVATNVNNITTVAEDIAAINEIYNNRLEIYEADTNAAIATDKANEASTSASNAQLSVWEAEAEAMTSNSYANEAEDVFVKIYTSNADGTFSSIDTTDYSSLHWSNKAGEATAGVVHIDGDETINDIKTFTSSPKVPDGVEPTDVVNKGQLDNSSISKVASNVLLSGNVAIDNTNLSITNGKLAFTNGRSLNGGYKVETQDFTGSVDFSGISDGIKYIARDKLGNVFGYDNVSIGLYDKTSADDNRLVFDTESGKWFTTTGGELVTNGTFDTDTSGWSVNDSTSWDEGMLVNTRNSTVGENISTQTIPTTIGETYTFNVSVNSSTASDGVTIQIRDANNNLTNIAGNNIGSNSAPNVYTFEITAETSSATIELGNYNGNGVSKFDNISVYKVEATLGTELPNPICFIDDKPYQVTSGTPMDRLVDYPSIPKNVMESTYVDGDLEVSGEVRGKNQCTAWVNFDGTTTPPTIRDSFNVSDVVRISTGLFEIVFSTTMDNANYSISGSGQYSTDGAENGAGVVVYPTRSATSLTVNRARIHTSQADTGTQRNSPNSMVQIIGGKN